MSIETFDIRTAVTDSFIDLFETMLDMDVQLLELKEAPESTEDQVSGALSLAGGVLGGVNIQVSKRFSRVMTAAMLGMDDEDIESDDEVKDVLLEVCNIIGGNLKSKLNDAGYDCEISTPSITSGQEFQIETRNVERYELLVFVHTGNYIVIQIWLKEAEEQDEDQAPKLKSIDLTKFKRLDIIISTGDKVIELFETMLSMDIELSDPTNFVDPDELQMVGLIKFAGDVRGSLNIQVSAPFGRMMTASMLGISYGEIDSEEEIKDVIGEVTNIIAGNIKSAFCDSGLNCVISTPSITTGRNFTIETLHMAKYERFAFRYESNKILVEVCVKINENAQVQELVDSFQKPEETQAPQPAADPPAQSATKSASEHIPADSVLDQSAVDALLARSAPPPKPEPEAPSSPEEAASPATLNLDFILNIPLEIIVELGRVQIPIHELLKLGPGSAIELVNLKGAPLDILTNNKLIARGEVVVEDEKYGIRITEIISSRERLEQLG